MIRKYQKSDLDALMQIWLEGNLDAHDFIDPSYWHDNYELVKKELPNAQLYVDEEEGEIHSDKGIDIDKWIKDNEEMQEEMFLASERWLFSFRYAAF